MARTSAFAVANFMIRKGREEGIPITHLKLQKLVYFCYAWFAGNEAEELFSEDIEAWQYGPVVRELYLEFRDAGSEPICDFAKTVDWDSGMFVAPHLDEALAFELQPVWDAYKSKSSAWLVEASHAPGEPWSFVKAKLGVAEKRKIPFDLVRRLYSERVASIAA